MTLYHYLIEALKDEQYKLSAIWARYFWPISLWFYEMAEGKNCF